MRSDFLEYIKKNNLFLKSDKLLVAVSGGKDSIVLTDLLALEGFNFEIAHCNFSLRGSESEKDEIFVKELANRYKVKFHSKRFNTEDYAKRNRISIQMAARDLRYTWFNKIKQKIRADYLLTAHHQNDSLETFLINLIRGTGIKGLLGIQTTKTAVRPLLFSNKKDISSYVKIKKLHFREDKSNASNEYTRNQIRNIILPLIEKINPQFQRTILKEKRYLKGVYEIYIKEIERLKKEVLIVKDKKVFIDLTKIKSLKRSEALMYEILTPYGFNSVPEIIEACFGQSGKQFFSSSYRLLIDRKVAIIDPILKTDTNIYTINEDDKELLNPINLNFTIQNQPKINKTEKSIASFDFSQLKFPLTLRKWRSGDRFVPLGMRGFKKISDFFIDNKLSRIEKESAWLLCSDEDIIWIIGHRIDNRYKVTKKSKKTYIATALNF